MDRYRFGPAESLSGAMPALTSRADHGRALHRRPSPAVKRVRARPHAWHRIGVYIAVTQRDDTLLVSSTEARRLARALLRAARA